MRTTKFNWKCIYCRKRNIEIIKFQFDVPQTYTAKWPCPKCGKYTQIDFIFSIDVPEV